MTAPPSGIIAAEPAEGRTQLEFDDNLLLPPLYGERDQHLDRIERQLGVSVITRGNRLAISGPPSATEAAQLALSRLYDRLKHGQEIDLPAVEAAIRLAEAEIADRSLSLWHEDAAFRTRKRRIAARSPGQAAYIKALRESDLVFGLGPAGTGKTYLAVAAAVDLLMTGRVERIILSRPAVEAGERLGFLPGDLRDKVDPYLRPIFDALNDMLPADQLARRLGTGEIEVAPIAFMRGRTLARAFVILDEAQNTTPVQIKMFLTRLGEGSRMVVTGDPTQVDLPPGTRSGLAEALETLDERRWDRRRPVYRPRRCSARIRCPHRSRLRSARTRSARRRAMTELTAVIDVASLCATWGQVCPAAEDLARSRRWPCFVAQQGGLRHRRNRQRSSSPSALADDAVQRQLNRDWRGVDQLRPMCSPSRPGNPRRRSRPARHCCSAMWCSPSRPSRARRMSRVSRSADHLSHLIVHGVLHLLGYDHATEAEAVAMESLETSILAKLGGAGSLSRHYVSSTKPNQFLDDRFRAARK